MTSHSPVVLRELHAKNIHIVRSNAGNTQIVQIPADLQEIVRRAPEAFLGKKLIVCEGRTEAGLCRGLDFGWAYKQKIPFPSFALRGVVPVTTSSGDGSVTPKRAKALKELGFKTALFIDSDNPSIQSDIEEAVAAGVHLIQWEGCNSTEERIINDLPFEGVLKVVDYAIDLVGIEAVSRINTRLKAQGIDVILPDEPSQWPSLGIEEFRLRQAIANAAKGSSKKGDKGWFKNIEPGEELAQIVLTYLPSIPDTDLHHKVIAIRAWVDEGEPS
jgi:hypothetical protein